MWSLALHLFRRRYGGLRRDGGMSTAEYAIGTIAAAALAAVLYQIVTSGAVSDALQSVIERALSTQP
ncbi:DUF4244 domain-containing protein [Streptomyces sp. DSM 44917]|uniref:DUF4244 domain-containing protein n=1 Tax=Streptomyces boetiae TaxID=3075541 RepID=A0ABU2LA87_9ACTN|nr:DUF4244 domain-containing protein [Streptomyces sp. DSM 44917]MDT0308412.1 DUF4244 domain-containing protein [Streptomyces sp. DSM 44917]